MEEKNENVVEETTQDQVEQKPVEEKTVEEKPQVEESKFESAGDDSIIKVDLSKPPVIPEENEEQVAWFLQRQRNFTAVSVSQIWKKVLDTECPSNALIDNTYLSLTPARHDTDGFFTAVLERTDN